MQSRRTLIALVASAAVAVLFLGAGGGPTISGPEARSLVKAGALLLDVRTPEEFAERHLEGAVNIPVQELEAKLGTVPAKKDQPVVVYCRSGVRSARAKGMLEKAGFTKVHDLGGIGNW